MLANYAPEWSFYVSRSIFTIKPFLYHYVRQKKIKILLFLKNNSKTTDFQYKSLNDTVKNMVKILNYFDFIHFIVYLVNMGWILPRSPIMHKFKNLTKTFLIERLFILGPYFNVSFFYSYILTLHLYHEAIIWSDDFFSLSYIIILFLNKTTFIDLLFSV